MSLGMRLWLWLGVFFFFSSRRRHTRFKCDWSSDVCSSDLVVLGAYQVSEKGDLANWGRPGRPATGMGGGMDLAAGAKKVIVTMLHTTKTGEPRIVKNCTYPLTAGRCVSTIITDLALIEVTGEGLVLKEIAPGWTVPEVQSLTQAMLIPAADLKEK